MPHTPGPWKATFDKDTRGRDVYRIDSPTVSLMAVLTIGDRELSEEVAANARLIASAPELLELLVLALPYIEEGEEFNKPSCRTLSKRARAAIAKASGE